MSQLLILILEVEKKKSIGLRQWFLQKVEVLANYGMLVALISNGNGPTKIAWEHDGLAQAILPVRVPVRAKAAFGERRNTGGSILDFTIFYSRNKSVQQRSTCFFSKGPDNRYLRLCGRMVSVIHWIVPPHPLNSCVEVLIPSIWECDYIWRWMIEEVKWGHSRALT